MSAEAKREIEALEEAVSDYYGDYSSGMAESRELVPPVVDQLAKEGRIDAWAAVSRQGIIQWGENNCGIEQSTGRISFEENVRRLGVFVVSYYSEANGSVADGGAGGDPEVRKFNDKISNLVVDRLREKMEGDQ